MHPNPVFRGTPDARSIEFLRQRGFGALIVNGPTHPLIAHVPFVLNDDTTELEVHVMRSNPVWQVAETETSAILAVTGPDGYVSPDWYGVPDQVPTWNYVAVHLHGSLRRVPHGELAAVLDRLSAQFEARLAPKRPWTSAKMTEGVMDRMMRMIVPMRLAVTGLHSTWKLNQNKPDEVRRRAADHVRAGIGSELEALAALMQAPPRQPE